ncbi:MAG: type II toxin-antitoxin system VapC family toxin [Deltaproteobacteria bacterium]
MLYAETSAVLRWLLNQEYAQEVRLELERADRVAASCLTQLECRRVLSRLTPELKPKDNSILRQMLFDATRRWLLVEMDQPVRDRAGEAFPVEPIRALDAIHLATCLELERALGPISVLSVDERVRANAVRLGLQVLPEDLPTARGP